MTQRKLWSQQQDEFLIKLVEIKSNKPQSKNTKWADIANQLNTKFKSVQRTGKQCRQRWHNQLDPNIKKQQWKVQQQTKLFELQKKLGNKWAQIANHLKGRTDNNVKNYFYSTLRKSLRKLNTFISNNRFELKNAKQFKQSSLSKLLAVADHKYDKKVNIKGNHTQDQAVQIKNMLIQISPIQISPSQSISKKQKKMLMILVEKMQNFNKSCKKKKSKRKYSNQGQMIAQEQQKQLLSPNQQSQSDEQYQNQDQIKQLRPNKIVNQIKRSRSRSKPNNQRIPNQLGFKKSKSKKEDKIIENNHEKGIGKGKGKKFQIQIVNTNKSSNQIKQKFKQYQLFSSFKNQFGNNSINLNEKQKPKPTESQILNGFSIQYSQELQDKNNQNMSLRKKMSSNSSNFFDKIKNISEMPHNLSNMSDIDVIAQQDDNRHYMSMFKRPSSFRETFNLVQKPSQTFQEIFKTFDFAPNNSSILDSSNNYESPILKTLRSFSQKQSFFSNQDYSLY